MKKHVHTMITAFRDGFQSAYGARVLTDDFLPAVEAAVEAGLTHFEAGGGARFQSLYFYCNEDAFTMMDRFREAAGPAADLQTLARGVNVVGLDSQPSDIIDLHAKLFKKHGISTIRNFDALNDINNLLYSGQCIVQAGLRHEVCVTMMEMPPNSNGAHTPEFYMNNLKEILNSGLHFDSICFKDASGTSVPSKVYNTIKQARALLGNDVHLVFHSHETAGIGVTCYKAALEAGADQIDLSLAPVSGGTCQTDVMTMWHALRGTEYDLGIDIEKIMKAEEVFKACMKDYFTPPEAKSVEPLIPFSPMPGGALTANTQMMRDNNILDRYPEVAKAMGEVVARGGFGTSVTPVSQFYFQQAFNNAMIGPWKKIAEGYGKMVLGYFGKTPSEPDPEIIKIAAEQLDMEPTTLKVLEINDKDPNRGINAAKKMLEEGGLPCTEENIFITATCKEKGIQFLKGEAKVNVRKNETPKKEISDKDKSSVKNLFTVSVNDKSYSVEIDDDKAIVDGTTYSIKVEEGIKEGHNKAAENSGAGSSAASTVSPSSANSGRAGSSSANAGSSRQSHAVEAPMPGLILRIEKKVGDQVQEGELILVMEAMKMETEIHAPASGTIKEIPVNQGDQKQAGDILAVIA